MSAIQQLLTDHIDIWTAAETEKKSGRGRASSTACSVYGVRKLRELILELAVRGKLMSQDATDETAGELLKLIQVEKAKLIADGKIKKNKPQPLLSEKEKPFSLPHGWEWQRLSNLCILENGDRGKNYPNKSSLVEDGIPFVNAGHLKNGEIDKDQMTFITKERFDILNGGKFQENDILFCLRGSLGKSAVVKGFHEGAIASSLIIIRLLPNLNTTYFLNYFYSPLSSVMVKKYDNGTAQPNLSSTDLAKFLVPLPPLAEQHRIAEKVDELMALCDQLEAQHSNAADAHEQLVNHLLGTLTQSQSAADFNANWQRVAVHFDTLFTTEASIDALKQTLLQLAVMGKLVAQDANEEPASELLKRIEAKKAKLVSEGKIKKEKLLATIDIDEKPFDLPKNWQWIRLGTLVEKSGAGWSPSCEGHARVGDSWGVLKVSAVSWGEFLPDENKALPATLEPRLDCVVESGDFLITRANTDELVARSVVVENCPPNLMLSDKIVRLRLSLLCNNKFINLVNLSPFSRNYYALAAGGTSSSMKNVTREQILNLVVGTPPLAEQHRIVAKVEELMAFCAQLKSRITTANQQQKKLADVLVEHAVVE